MFNSSKYQIVRQQLSNEQRIDALGKLNDLIDDSENPVEDEDLKREGKKLIYNYSEQINLVWKESNYSPYTGSIYYQPVVKNRWQMFLQPVNEIKINHLTQLEDIISDQEKSTYQAELLLQGIFLVSLVGFWVTLVLSFSSSALSTFLMTSLLFMVIGCSAFTVAFKLYLKRLDYQSMRNKMTGTGNSIITDS
jgi:hypothetical protein